MMPKLEVRRLRRMHAVVNSIVSNAALKSRERRVASEPVISCLVDRIKEVNERRFSKVMSVIS